jgi:hypothetical protein
MRHAYFNDAREADAKRSHFESQTADAASKKTATSKLQAPKALPSLAGVEANGAGGLSDLHALSIETSPIVPKMQPIANQKNSTHSGAPSHSLPPISINATGSLKQARGDASVPSTTRSNHSLQRNQQPAPAPILKKNKKAEKANTMVSVCSATVLIGLS